jgi:predicted P-loop ATPase/GTPase
MYLEQKLDEMQEQLKTLSQFMMMMMPDLTNKKNVQHFLQITRQTMATYMKEGIIKEDVHFYFDDNGNEVFIPEEIIKLRAFGVRKQPSKMKDDKASKILANMGIRV